MSNQKSQIERFKEAARQLEADDDEERFNEKLRELAKGRNRSKSDGKDHGGGA